MLCATAPFDQNFEPPYSSLQIGTISADAAVNIIPDLLRSWSWKPAQFPAYRRTVLLEPIKAAAEALREAAVSAPPGKSAAPIPRFRLMPTRRSPG